MIANMFARLKSGETIHAKADDFLFDVRPERWEGIVLGYTLLVGGQVVPSRKGIMLEKAEVDDWAGLLDEQ
jgi:hypothetical protein